MSKRRLIVMEFAFRRLMIMFLILSSVFLIAARFLQEGPPEFGALGDVLVWIFAGGGAMWLMGKVMAFILENWAAYHNFPLIIKKLFPVVISGLLALLAESLYVSGLLDMLPAYISAAILWAINYLFSQKQYKEIKEGAYGDRTRAVAYAAKTPPTPQG